MKTDDTQTPALSVSRGKLPEVKAVSVCLISQAITVCPDFFLRVSELRHAYQYSLATESLFVSSLKGA